MQKLVQPLLNWYKKNARALPWRENITPYKVWVSEIMLQQTRIEAARDYYRRFIEAFPTVEALAKADIDEVLKLWEGLGYYSRARNLMAAARRFSMPRLIRGVELCVEADYAMKSSAEDDVELLKDCVIRIAAGEDDVQSV